MKSNRVNALWFGLIIVTLYTCCNTEASCIPGSRHCIKLRNYNDYQWSTCRSDAYIRRTTKDKHFCEHNDATYCYYQCMFKVYGLSGGDVYGSCRCSLGSLDENSTPSPTTNSNNIGVIVGSAAAVVTVVVAAIFIAVCCLFRRLKEEERDLGFIQNAAYQGERPLPGANHENAIIQNENRQYRNNLNYN